MTRHTLLALLAFGLVASASAQTDPMPTDTPALPADSAAADTTEAAIELDPERARSLYDEGAGLLRARDFQAALLKFEEALLYNPSYAAAGLGRAQSLAAQRRLEDARNAFEEAIAMAEASDASNAASIKETAERQLEQVASVLDQQAAAAQAQADADAAAGVQAKVTEATQILSANEVSFEQAADAYALLEQARMDGFDANSVAYYYAKALVAMERGADAVPYAETAVTQSEGQPDRSSYYILLAQAELGAGNAAGARAALESISEGEAWHGWVPHYMGQVEALEAEG